MTDDPRDVLREAGVECAEVERYMGWGPPDEDDDVAITADAAILDLARLVAKYKWAAESLQTELLRAALDLGFFIPTLAARLAEYEADHA